MLVSHSLCDIMAAFKILAALFVVCVAQNAVSAGIFGRDKPAGTQDETQLTDSQSFGLSRANNPFACMAYLPEAFNVIQEIRGRWTEYQDIKETVALMKAKCNKLEVAAAKDQCYREADQTYSDKSSEVVIKFQPILPKLVQLGLKFKKCLFDGEA